MGCRIVRGLTGMGIKSEVLKQIKKKKKEYDVYRKGLNKRKK